MRSIILIAVLALIGGSIYFLERQSADRTSLADVISLTPRTFDAEDKARVYPTAKEITTPDGFINTDEIALADLIGKKVILIDFWTYSCINCQRTTPYLNSWYEKYKNQGLEIIGVHTPEFEFEKKYENVLAATERFGIMFPVVLDNDFSTWTAYQNRYWPRKYLIDIDGYVVYDHIGEGGYEETEKKIQELLKERMEVLGEEGNVSTDITKEVSKTSRPDSPEIYFGAWRNEHFGSGPQNAVGSQSFYAPEEVKLNTLYLDGVWSITEEYAENVTADGKIIFRFKAKEVNFVAGAETPVRAKVLVDGVPAQGSAVDSDGYITVDEEQLYNLVSSEEKEEHTIEIIPESPGLQAFTFTFG